MRYPSAILRWSFAIACVMLLTLLPSSAHAQAQAPTGSDSAPYDFRNEGIFGCNQISGALGSAGTMSAIGGVYVPVNDAAVTLNTGILVYKECILRPLQNRLREAATAALLKRQYAGILAGREGNSQYVVNRTDERAVVANRALLASLTDEEVLEKMQPSFRTPVRSAVARGYQAGRAPESELECTYEGNVEEVLRGRVPAEGGGVPNVLHALNVLKDPACHPIGSYSILTRISNDRVNQAVNDWETTVAEGRGYYAVTDNADDPLEERILTPAAVVQESFQQIIGSPVRQLEQADDVGEIIGALFSGITTQALTDQRGLAGLSQTIAGRPSYLDQLTRESSQGVIGAAVNAALTILNAARQTEASFLAVMNAIADNLAQAIEQLRNIERQCWALIVPRAQEYARQNGIVLDQARIDQTVSSLAFSQQIIDSQITPVASVALSNVESSQSTLARLDELIAGVTNTASLSAQRLALQQLDALVAGGALHSQFDVTNATEQRDEIRAAMESLVADTARAWGDSPDSSVGWCNINNENVPRLWAERWRIQP